MLNFYKFYIFFACLGSSTARMIDLWWWSVWGWTWTGLDQRLWSRADIATIISCKKGFWKFKYLFCPHHKAFVGGQVFLLLLLFDLAESIKVLIDSVLWNVWGWSDQTFMNYLRNIQPWLGGQFKVSWILLSKLILCAKIDLAKITKLWLIQCCEVFGVVSGQPVMAEDQRLLAALHITQSLQPYWSPLNQLRLKKNHKKGV